MFFLVFGLSANSFGKKSSPNAAQNAEALKSLENSLAEYAKYKHLSFEIEKTVKSELLMTETKQKGQLNLERDRFRLELKGDRPSLIVFDGQYLWSQEGTQVTRSSLKSSQNEFNIFNRIFFEAKISSDFKLISSTQNASNKDEILFRLEPLGNKFSFKEVEVTLKKAKITKISYLDDLESRTEIRILSEKRNPKVQPKLFKYSPKAGVKVTEL